MKPHDDHSGKDSPANLLRELETLQRVLDGAADDQIELEKRIPVLDPLDDIPLLDDLIHHPDMPVLKAVRNEPVAQPATPARPATASNSRFSASNISRILQQSQPALQQQPPAPAPSPLAAATAPRTSANPFLPQSVLDRLTQEREAAQHSAAQAQRTLQKVLEQNQQRAHAALSGMDSSRLSAEQKEALVEQLVQEMLPQITQRLRDKLHLLLNR